MKPITRILVALSVTFLLSSCAVLRTGARSEIAASSAPQSVLVQAPDGSYSMQVPAGWQSQAASSQGAGLQLVYENDARAGLMIVRSFPTLIAPDPGSLGQIREGVIEGLREQTRDFVLESQREITVEQHKGFQVRYRCAFEGTPVKGTLTVLADQGGLFSVNLVSPRAKFGRAEVALDRLLSSLRSQERDIQIAERGGPITVAPRGGVFGPTEDDTRMTVAGR